MRRQSLVSVLSDKLRQDALLVLDDLTLERPTTSEMVRVLSVLGAGPSVLLVADGVDSTVLRSARNIPRLRMRPASLLNTLEVLKGGKIVMTLAAVRRVEELWGGPFHRRKSGAASAVERA
jgi:large subunit ribosomal protein L4